METFGNIIISWTPMIILIGVWVFYMRKMRAPQDHAIEFYQKSIDLMKQYVDNTGRIAVALERLNAKDMEKD